MPSIINTKIELRKRVRAELGTMDPGQRRESDQVLAERFLALDCTQRAQTVLLFYGLPPEPDTVPILEALWARGKTVALPVCLPGRAMEARQVLSGRDVSPGTLGIPEPSKDCQVWARDRIDLILVPSVCCDRTGRRLGQGGGYYDRYLADYRGDTVGLCRDAVLQTLLPWEEHDVPLGLVLTETLCLSFSGAGEGRDQPVPPMRQEDTEAK